MRQLSGGEKARILIARLMIQPADVLLLDEPTNDLDIPSLEVLEESLTEFGGALVLVTHDRYLLDRVCNVILALDGEGVARPYADLNQWENAQRERPAAAATAGGTDSKRADDDKGAAGEKGGTAEKSKGANSVKPKRLTYQEQRELETIEAKIHAAETEMAECQTQLEDPAVTADHMQLRKWCEKLETAQHAVEGLFHRWQELEAKQKAAAN